MKVRTQQVKTDRIISNNKLDVTVGDKSGNEKGTCLLTDTEM
jgi:hypothetical protein